MPRECWGLARKGQHDNAYRGIHFFVKSGTLNESRMVNMLVDVELQYVGNFRKLDLSFPLSLINPGLGPGGFIYTKNSMKPQLQDPIQGLLHLEKTRDPLFSFSNTVLGAPQNPMLSILDPFCYISWLGQV